jgi:RNA-binding protein YhbY
VNDPTASERRALRRRAATLTARLHVGRHGLTAGVVEEVRRALAAEGLLKVRVVGYDRASVERMADELAARTPCVLVGRVGFVITLARPRETKG